MSEEVFIASNGFTVWLSEKHTKERGETVVATSPLRGYKKESEEQHDRDSRIAADEWFAAHEKEQEE